MLKLKSLKFPWSFPTDIIHLFLVHKCIHIEAKISLKKYIPTMIMYFLNWNGKQMDSLKNEMSSEIGHPSRDIFKYHNSFKAN